MPKCINKYASEQPDGTAELSRARAGGREGFPPRHGSCEPRGYRFTYATVNMMGIPVDTNTNPSVRAVCRQLRDPNNDPPSQGLSFTNQIIQAIQVNTLTIQ